MSTHSSSDQQKKVGNRELGYNIFEGELTITGPLSSAGGTGYVGYVELDLKQFNLATLTPEFEVYYRKSFSLGGGINQFLFYKCPLVIHDSNGDIDEAVSVSIGYQAEGFKEALEPDTSFLTVWYYNRTSSSGVSPFYYKIKGSDLVPADAT